MSAGAAPAGRLATTLSGRFGLPSAPTTRGRPSGAGRDRAERDESARRSEALNACPRCAGSHGPEADESPPVESPKGGPRRAAIRPAAWRRVTRRALGRSPPLHSEGTEDEGETRHPHQKRAAERWLLDMSAERPEPRLFLLRNQCVGFILPAPMRHPPRTVHGAQALVEFRWIRRACGQRRKGLASANASAAIDLGAGIDLHMKLTRLRLLGFKSFVEPTDFHIEPGLTGVVGPNGCGKSNLVEALRWVMGETSHKSLRAADMDDVIFSGTNNRPVAQQRRSGDARRQHGSQGAGAVQRARSSSTSRAGSSARRARPTASTAARCAPATCTSCSPTPRPARARRRWCIRAASARSSRPSPSSAAACWKKPPAFPACMRAAMRRSCGCARPSTICSGWRT